MKKQLRKLLSALLVLTMLLSALPMGVFAEEEHTPVAADELTEEATKELNADPTAEPTEEPAAEPTVVPAPGAAEAPAAQPTVAPIVDSTDDALETATTGEPETEPEKEPETTPAAEDEVDEGKPEETPAPAENNDDDTLSGLTDEQRKTLNALPEGFSADVVAFAMLRSTGCAHTDLYVGDVFDSEQFTKLNKEKHIRVFVCKQRTLRCNFCGETLQTINCTKTITEERSHQWDWTYDSDRAIYDFTCVGCGEKKTVNPPCSHGEVVLANSGIFCPKCGAELGGFCEHTNYTVFYPNKEYVKYSRWDDNTHLKTTTVWIYSSGCSALDGFCNDCRSYIVCKLNGDYDYDGNTTLVSEEQKATSIFEAHNFINGVCEHCGEEQTEEVCQHTETKRVENVDKRTTELKPWDENEHEVATTKYYELYCVACDTYISDDGDETTTEKQPHDFGSGTTCACGYTKVEETCQHTETKRVENTDKRTTELKSLNETEHEVTTTKYYELHCAACDVYISDDGTDATTEKQPHDFGSSNTCACGYVKAEEPCQHTETKRVENTGKRTTELKSLNETEHEVTTTKYYELHCAVCDAYISDDGTDTTTEKQPHDFSSGTTCVCGYTKAVEPSGKSVIKNVSISANAKACVEKVGGETFAVTVTCNLDTVCVEMYFGKEHNQNTYRESSDYVETNGNRIFKMTYTLGGDGKSYAGEYPISVRPFSYVDRADWKNNQMGEEVKIMLKVTHDNVSTVNEGGYSYSWSANGHTRMQTITTTLECKVCGNVSKSSTKIAKGSEESHDLKENGKCSVCGYSEKLVHPGKDGNWKTKAPIVVYPNAVDELLTWDRTGKIRYVEQKWNSGNNGSYRAKYWTNVDQSEGKCTRAAASMALSYMGIDLLPKDMVGDHCKTGYKEDASAKDSSCNTRGRSTNSAGEEYEMTYDKFLELYNDYASDEEGKYSPVVIHTVRWVKITNKDGKEEWVRKTHAFIVVGHDQSDPDYFYVVDPGHGENGGTGRIKLTQEGQMRVADYQCYKDGKWNSLYKNTRYAADCKLIGVWQYYKEV